AERTARQELDAAAADIARAEEYERQHDADIDDAVKDELRRAREIYQQASRLEDRTGKPDYLEIVRLAQEANGLADRILAKCQSEYEAAERLRKKATSAVRDAELAVAGAQGYISGHTYDIGEEVRAALRIANGALQSARAMRDPTQQVAEAQRAKGEAERAHRQAQYDVERRSRARLDASDAVAFIAGAAVGQAMAPRGRTAHVNDGVQRAAPSAPSRSSGHATSYGGGGGGGGGAAPRSSGRATKW
ncbi:MAG: hypothetical protein Q8R16_03070, partial [bacterium]|nr:hypothetical protein [bacterium]